MGARQYPFIHAVEGYGKAERSHAGVLDSHVAAL